MTKILTVATRGGQLALAQTRIVTDALQEAHPDVTIKVKKVATRGDRDRRTALWNLKTTGFFTSRVEDALLAGEADLAVHSFKDLPTQQREGLTIAAVCDRKFAQDCVVTADPVRSIGQLAKAAKVGTSSLRRAAQIKHLRADLQCVPIRGNVQTRLKKLDAGKYDAIVLAKAGLERLGLSERISIDLEPTQFIPAPAQGALAVQIRSNDEATAALVSAIDDERARTATLAERQILVTMQCGCHAPVGAWANIARDEIRICAFISDLDGKHFIRREIAGPIHDADKLAKELAGNLLSAGGEKILQNI
jgi:hydroxymethylbilane synthase